MRWTPRLTGFGPWRPGRGARGVVTLAALSALAGCSGNAAPAASDDTWSDAGRALEDNATVRHMHLHAEQLDKLNAALDAGDLEAAATPAYWLSRHEQLDGVPPHWWPRLDRMRAAATVVEEATDLGTARAAAARLEQACEDCHRANEVSLR